ncbi:MAG: hypothetical protein VKJ24_00785 [Synechococcales bacterium]|nr:hypothetical protein [Synechococcales bacterium]
MRLGKVVKSNSHCDYVVQLDEPTEFRDAPTANDYGFGTFVKLEDEHRHWAVGLIYNSQLLNPSFNALGPRLTSEPDPIFAPDLITETRTVLWTVLIGNLESVSNKAQIYGVQGIPRVVVPVNTAVYRMTATEVYQFHQDVLGRSQFTYYSHLLRSGGTFATQLTYQVLLELINSQQFSGADERALIVLARDLAWRNTVGMMGRSI